MKKPNYKQFSNHGGFALGDFLEHANSSGPMNAEMLRQAQR
jgi:hypothetical protein